MLDKMFMLDKMIKLDDYSKTDFDIINVVYTYESKFTRVFNNKIKRYGVISILRNVSMNSLAKKFAQEYSFSKKDLHNIKLSNPNKYYNILKLYMVCELLSLSTTNMYIGCAINKNIFYNLDAIRSDYIYKEIYFRWLDKSNYHMAHYTHLVCAINLTGCSLSSIYSSLSPISISSVIKPSDYDIIANSNVYYQEYLDNNDSDHDHIKFNSIISRHTTRWALEQNVQKTLNFSNVIFLNFIADKIMGSEKNITCVDRLFRERVSFICNKITPEEYSNLNQEACAIMLVFNHKFPCTLVNKEYINFSIKNIFNLLNSGLACEIDLVYKLLLNYPYKIYVNSGMITKFILNTRNKVHVNSDTDNISIYCDILLFLLCNIEDRYIFNRKNIEILTTEYRADRGHFMLNKLYGEILATYNTNSSKGCMLTLRSLGFVIDNEERFY